MSVTVLGVVLLLFAKAAFRGRSEGLSPLGLTLLGLGLGTLALSFLIKIRWRIEYEGHEIRFENDPLRGEGLYLDGALIARGQRGVKNELQATLPDGPAAGQKITSSSEAHTLHFHCRITVAPAAE